MAEKLRVLNEAASKVFEKLMKEQDGDFNATEALNQAQWLVGPGETMVEADQVLEGGKLPAGLGQYEEIVYMTNGGT